MSSEPKPMYYGHTKAEIDQHYQDLQETKDAMELAIRTKELTGGSSDYYELPKGAQELQDLIEYRHMNFSIGNIFKACYRLGRKSGTKMEYDLEKIIWYATRELERIRES